MNQIINMVIRGVINYVIRHGIGAVMGFMVGFFARKPKANLDIKTEAPQGQIRLTKEEEEKIRAMRKMRF